MDPLEFTPNSFDIRSLFRRDCVECPNVPLKCPTCPDGQVCVQVSQTCDQCASRECVPNAGSGAANNAPVVHRDSGPNIGAIVGGVVGGVFVIALITFLIYWFVIRKRRQQWEQEYVADFDRYSEKGTQGDRTSSQRARSIGPRHSTASTTYTRSSNVIQIAFIPGITDQEHTPPVPPIPSSQPHSPYTDASGDHYFMPGDLRDSTYSGFTDDGASTIDRRSMARSIAPSIAPSLLRESVASHVFNDTLTNPMPAQTALRGRANMVSVQRSANASRSPSVPAVPTIDRSKYPAPQQSSNALAGASGSSASRSRTELAPRSPDVPSIQVTSDSASAHTDDDGLSFRSAQPDLRGAIQEATRRASARPTHGGFGTAKPSTPGSANRDPSPFSDANRLPESSSAETTPRT